MSINVNDKNLGHATAYAYYKAGGGTMTEAEFTEFMADFGTASQTAVEAAQAALASKNAAQTAATTATNKASEATTAAQTATTKAAEASTSASTATSAKDTAVSASQTATTKAGEATTAAATATSAATTATTAKDDAVSAKTAAQTAQTGAETAAASVSTSAAQIATNTEDIAQLKSEKADVTDLLKAFPTDTVIGAVASFSDGANLPLKSLVVNIDPVQDLHGYDSPWPAGGGKNLFNPSPYADYLQSNGKYRTKAAYTAQKRTQIPASLLNTVCVFSVYMDLTNSGTLFNAFVQVVIGGTIKKGNLIVNGSTGRSEVSFTPTSTDDYVSITYGSNGDNEYTYYDMQLEAGTTASAFAPYSNICPISGWTEVQTNQSGVNVWDEEVQLGYYNASGAYSSANNQLCTKNIIPIPSAELSMRVPIASGYDTLGVCEYDSSKSFIQRVSLTSYSASTGYCLYTPSEKCRYIHINFGIPYGTTYNHDISINYPSTDHEYHPYTGRSITIDLGQTVYGGKLDVLSGVLTVDRTMVDLGTLNWETYGFTSNYDRYISGGIDSTAKTNGECMSSKYITKTGSTTYPNMVYISSGSSKLNITTGVGDFASAAAFKAILNGVYLVYELATPTTVSLTPNELSTLFGANNIWSDAGKVTAEYRADPTLYIQKKIAEAISALS